MAHRIQNEASKNKITYISGKPKKDSINDYSYYLDVQIYQMAQSIGAEEAIQYLQDKIKTIKKEAGK